MQYDGFCQESWRIFWNVSPYCKKNGDMNQNGPKLLNSMFYNDPENIVLYIDIQITQFNIDRFDLEKFAKDYECLKAEIIRFPFHLMKCWDHIARANMRNEHAYNPYVLMLESLYQVWLCTNLDNSIDNKISFLILMCLMVYKFTQ